MKALLFIAIIASGCFAQASDYSPNYWSLKTSVDGAELIIDANNPAASGAIVDGRAWEAVTPKNPRTGVTCKVRFTTVIENGGVAEIEETNSTGETRSVHFEGNFYSSNGGCTFARSDKLHF